MSNKSIPILISVMAIALIGIIVIQYRWIDKSLAEKQKLIDKNVMLSVSNTEQQLNDHRAMAFINDSVFNEFSFENIIELGDTQIIHQEFITDSTKKLEVKVMSSNSTEDFEESKMQIIVQNDHNHNIQINSDSLSFTHYSDELGHMESLINRMKIEVHSSKGDIRLGSTHVADILTYELSVNDLGSIQDWGIFDNQKAEYLIQPKYVSMIDYDIPLFTTDIMNPGRYDLQLRIDKDQLIWKEIWFMILLSLLFIIIISLVFSYSIRLIIKHKKISQIKSDFINNMTHEFKTPLASISLAADSLLHPNNDLNRESLEKFVGIIQQEKTKLNSQVERILEVASLNKDSLDVPLSTIDINEIIELAISNLSMLIEKENAIINFQQTADFKVRANAYHLENVLINLIENGIKYSEDPPRITVKIEEDKGKCLIQVSDEGIGMSEHQIKKAFDNFYRVQTGNLHDTKGFGLGLSYSKLIIEKMHGSISLKSMVGKGTTVTLNLNLDE